MSPKFLPSSNDWPWDDELIAAIKPYVALANLTLVSPDAPYVVCPGREFHTHPNKDTDCHIWFNFGHVRLSCFHQSCAKAVARANGVLAGLDPSLAVGCPGFDPKQQVLCDGLPGLNLPRILESPWSYNDIQADSPTKLEDEPSMHWRLLMTLFNPDDVIWVGRDYYDAGKPLHARRFRAASEWQREEFCPGPFVCPNTFIPGSYERTGKNILHIRYLVVESDELNHDETGAVFRFLQESPFNLKLRAVVDTAGKSLHGWFEYPDLRLFETVRQLIPRLKCDSQLMNANQSCRLPGAKRGARHQRLIYLR